MYHKLFLAQLLSTYRLYKSIKQGAGEMVSDENSGVYQMLTLSPIKDFNLIPGFDDTSSEELRVKASQAKQDPVLLQEYQKMLYDKMSSHRQLYASLFTRARPEAFRQLLPENNSTLC